MGIFQRVVEQTGSDESGRVSHVNHEQGAYFVGNATHASVVPFARICAGATHNQFWMYAASCFFHLVVVNKPGVFFHVVFHLVEHQSREVYWAAVRQVTAVSEVQAHESVARFHHSHEHSHVGLGTRVRLHVGIFGAKELLEAFDGKRFSFVHHLTATVVAVSGVSFGIFVCKARTHGLHNLVANKVFRCDKFDAFFLALVFAFNNVEN